MNAVRKLVYPTKITTVCKSSTGCQACSHFVDEETEAENVKNKETKRTKTFSSLHRQEV